MKQLFNVNSPIMRLFSYLADLCLINLLWLLGCIPVVTIGASTAALYHITQKLVQKQEVVSIRKEYVSAFKENFKSATVVWMYLILAAAVCLFNIWLLYTGYITDLMVIVLTCLLPAVLWLFVFTYAFPYASRYVDPPKVILKNALILSIANFPVSVIMAVIHLFPVILFLISAEMYFKLFIYWLLFGNALCAMVNSKMLVRIFQKL